MGFKNISHVEGGFKAIEDGGFQIEKIELIYFFASRKTNSNLS